MRKITMKGAWKLGFQTCLDGRPVSANPFEPQRAIFESWKDGWRTAQTSRQTARPAPAPRAPCVAEDLTLPRPEPAQQASRHRLRSAG